MALFVPETGSSTELSHLCSFGGGKYILLAIFSVLNVLIALFSY